MFKQMTDGGFYERNSFPYLYGHDPGGEIHPERREYLYDPPGRNRRCSSTAVMTLPPRWPFLRMYLRPFICRPEKTALLLTHYHIDHVGMVWWFRKKGLPSTHECTGIRGCPHRHDPHPHESATPGDATMQKFPSSASGYLIREITVPFFPRCESSLSGGRAGHRLTG